MTNWPLIHTYEALLSEWRAKYDYRHRQLVIATAKAEFNERIHHADRLKFWRAEQAKWGGLEGDAARKVHDYAAKIHKLRPASPVPAGEGCCVPLTWWNPNRRRIANWIARKLYFAYEHGATGYVLSGLRTDAEQLYLYNLYRYHGGNIAAPPGVSNHRSCILPLGAIDHTNARGLYLICKSAPGPSLIWAVAAWLNDTNHLSHLGR